MALLPWVAGRQPPSDPASAGLTSPPLRTSRSPSASGCSSGLSSSISSITRTSTLPDLEATVWYPSADRQTTLVRTSEKLDPPAMLRMIRGRFSLPSSCITETLNDRGRARSRALRLVALSSLKRCYHTNAVVFRRRFMCTVSAALLTCSPVHAALSVLQKNPLPDHEQLERKFQTASE